MQEARPKLAITTTDTSIPEITSVVFIAMLPDELLLRVFSYLSGSECAMISFVCHQWRALALDDYLWYELVKREVKRELKEIELKKLDEARKQQQQREEESRKIAAEDKSNASSSPPTPTAPVSAVVPLNQSGPIPIDHSVVITVVAVALPDAKPKEIIVVPTSSAIEEERATATASPAISASRLRQSQLPPEELRKKKESEEQKKKQYMKAKALKLIRPRSRDWRWVYSSKTRMMEKPHRDKVTGIGKFIWNNGAYYEGEWKDGLPDGIGIKFWDETEYYEGTWVQGKMHGEGMYHWPDGATFTGGWKDGYHDGEGTYVWADGNKYTGGWKIGHRDGWGVRTWMDGDLFEGEWVEGKRTGRGTYSWPNGSKYVGEWENGSHHGQGTYTWLDGRKYEGSWENSKKHGKGTYYWPDGCMYSGEWKLGHRNGKGKMVWADGTMYEGTFANDQRVPSQGECYESDGTRKWNDWTSPKPYDNYFAEAEGVWEKKYRPEISARRLAALEKMKREAPELPLPIRESKVLDPEG